MAMTATFCRTNEHRQGLITETGNLDPLSAGTGIPELAVMADVLNLETESTPLNTQLETPELESVTELQEPSLESTSNPVVSEELETVDASAVESALATVESETAQASSAEV